MTRPINKIERDIADMYAAYGGFGVRDDGRGGDIPTPPDPEARRQYARLVDEMNLARAEATVRAARTSPARSARRSTARSTYCAKCKTSGVPGTRCKCPPKKRSKPVAQLAPRPRMTQSEGRYKIFNAGAFKEDSDIFRGTDQSYAIKRDIALQTLAAECRDLPPSAIDRIDALVRRTDTDVNGRRVAEWVIACGSSAYRSAFTKSMSEVRPAFNPEEMRALSFYHEHVASRAASEGGSFGLALPIMIDPTIITGGALDDASIMSVAKVVHTTTNTWKGVSSTGGSGFTLPGEGVVAADGTPAFTQPTVPIFTLTDFIPYSMELGQDFPGWSTTEMPRLFQANYLDSVSKDTAVGAGGTSAPEGIFTGLVGVTNSTVSVTTAGTIGAVDVRAAWAALPERMKNDPSCAWAMSNSVWQQISALGAPSVTNGLAPHDVGSFQDGTARLLGKPVVISSYDPAFTGTTGTAQYCVVGAFSRYAVAQRIAGVTVELVPQLRDPSTGRPTGERGLLAFARYGAGVLDPASFVILTN